MAGFCYAAEEIEIFGQAQPTAQQHGWRHLLVAHAVLQAGGAGWRTAVQRLKQQGFKTEPAFARLLGLPGDPYAALLMLAGVPQPALRRPVATRPLPAAE